MIEQSIPECALGLTTDTLSAWHDGGFRDDEEQRIRQHATTCAACQQRLDGFATVARALERQRELEPGDRIWRGVQNRIASQRRTGITLPRPFGWSWQGVVSAASVILVVGLLAYVFNAVRAQRSVPAPASTATSAITPTLTPTLTSSVIIPGPQLVWQPTRFPSGVEVTSTSLALAPPVVAPSDGNVAYLCVAPGQGEATAHIYITRDRGQTWARGKDLPVGAQPPSSGNAVVFMCGIGVDATRPDTAVVEAGWEQGGASDPERIATLVSSDYGAHWRILAPPQPFLSGQRIASYAGAIFAAGAVETQRDASAGAGLWVSHDQMTTWQALPLPSGIHVSDFWLNPSTGALLLAAYGQGSVDSLLFTSVDGGVQWTPLSTPAIAQLHWVVQAPQGDKPWRMCGAAAPADDPSPPEENTLTCSNDGGQTWASRPALNLAANPGKNPQAAAPAGVFALTSDGAALAVVGGATDHLYRLPAGGAAWQDLGPAPMYSQPGPMYFPTPTGGALWMNGSGSDVFRATYPSA